jgi:hypothetical protein
MLCGTTTCHECLRDEQILNNNNNNNNRKKEKAQADIRSILRLLLVYVHDDMLFVTGIALLLFHLLFVALILGACVVCQGVCV